MPKNLSLKFLLALTVCTSGLMATDRFNGEPQAVMEGDSAAPWALIERHRDPHPRFPNEPFHTRLAQFYPQTIEALGSKTPHSSVFALYAAPGWDGSEQPVPVLLIHGANDDATRRYAHPKSPHAEDHLESSGLMQDLASKGFSVFAVSFSHFHGDNLFQGEQIANAITRIRQLMGQEENQDFKVDLVTFSKGIMAARSYLQSMGEYYGMKYLTPFRHDVRRVVFQCGPIAGLDTMFRYYMYNLTLASQEIPAPMGADKMLMYGSWKDMGENHIHSGYWPGQLQMVHDQREIGIADGVMSVTADFNQTAHVLRNGGRSLYISSYGLEKARLAGGRMIEVMNEKGLPSDVSAAILAGNHHIIYDERYDGWKIPIGVELTAESDGLVYLKSATYTEGLTAQGARITGMKTLKLNHIDLSRSQDAFEFVSTELMKP